MHFMFGINMRNNYVNRLYTVKMRNHAEFDKITICLLGYL